MKNVLSDFNISNCSGCGACINSCPTKALSFGVDSYGFTVPAIDNEKCIECTKCIKVCPFNNIESGDTAKSVYAVFNKDDDTLLRSSSGGVFAEIAKTVLGGGGVVFGCAMNKDFRVEHICIDSVDDLPKLMKSKYVQSFAGISYSEVKKLLKDGKQVLFTGTPCMVAGLKSYLGKFSTDNLITVDVVCHGITNQQLFDDYIKHLGRKVGSPIETYTFRAKDKVKNGMEWNVMYSSRGKKYKRNWPEDCYNNYYMKAATYRDSCYECPFASSHRYSDITMCDFWGWQDCGLPFDYRDAVSGVIINSEKGQLMFDMIRDRFNLAVSDFNSVSRHNGNLSKPCAKPPVRSKILNMWQSEGFQSLDCYFRKNNKLQILKYRIMRYIPYSIIYRLNKCL